MASSAIIAFGETRLTTGTIYTDKLFTGQREMAGLGIYHYQARFYSPKLGRFLSPDAIIPGYTNPQAFNRFSYVLGNPLRYTDPTGHVPCQGANWDDGPQCVGTLGFKENADKDKLVSDIHKKFRNVKIKDVYKWALSDLQEIYTGLTEISSTGFNNDMDAFSVAFGEVTFNPVALGSLGYIDGRPVPGNARWQDGTINLAPNAIWEIVVHEMGHIFDGSLSRMNGNVLPIRSKTYADIFNTLGVTTERGRANPSEDFADSFLAVIKYGPQTTRVDKPRVTTILALIQSYTSPGHSGSPGR